MITPMMKYSLVVYHKEYEEFLKQLQGLGLVDITVRSWEPTDSQRTLLSDIDKLRQAGAALKTMPQTGETPQRKYAGVTEALEAYNQASRKIESLNTELAKVGKETEELRPWGEFDPADIQTLKQAGINLHFYRLSNNEFASVRDDWNSRYALQEISHDGQHYYFIIAAPVDEPLDVDAQEMTPPVADYARKRTEQEAIRQEITAQEEIIASCAAYAADFAKERERLTDQLHLEKVLQGGQREAEGTLVVLEGWAATEHQAEVDTLLEQTGVFYVKERPTPDDEVPVLLKNNRFARLFELIGNIYALPKYGSMDLTPFFAPFYMLFFGFCLADAGYGLLLFLGGLFLLFKGGEKMKSPGKLTLLCGGATMVFGFLVGSFFGIPLAEQKMFAGIHDYFLSTDNLFTLALALGIIQILFGMLLKVITVTRQFGFKYTLATIGWMIVIISGLGAMFLPDMGVSFFAPNTPAFLVCLGIGLFMMLFLNSPGKNPFVNFGSGLWNTYNDVTGLMGDVLSYIRLFAIGLSGGILALVFNDLAFGLSPDIPVVRELVILVILLIGHGINLFMSCLSSFVHPMRLTFVEFYKNAGFDSTQRIFTPLKQQKK